MYMSHTFKEVMNKFEDFSPYLSFNLVHWTFKKIQHGIFCVQMDKINRNLEPHGLLNLSYVLNL